MLCFTKYQKVMIYIPSIDKGTDSTVTYDTMKANVTVTVSHDGTAKLLVAKVGEIADKEFKRIYNITFWKL